MDWYGPLFQHGLTRLDAEVAHALALGALQAASSAPRLVAQAARAPRSDALAVTRFGVRFGNPLGVAAGLDKNGVAVPALLALGFGHVEVGTVTPRPQPGNPRPRMFRLREDAAVVNRMGFPSAGMDAVAGRLARLRATRGVIGVNVGKNLVTPIESAVDDYRRVLARLGLFADYGVVNVSSPNTPGLRLLQGRVLADELCAALLEARPVGRHGRPLPLLLKIAPDLTDRELDDVLDVVLARGLDGLVVANTTLARQGLRSPLAAQAGGLSGAPLRERVEGLVADCRARAGGRLTLVAVGGVFDAQDAWRLLLAGASLVQVYTGFVYRGPGLAAQILDGLHRQLERLGAASLDDVIGRGITSA